MALHLCRETFTGELAPGVAKTFHAGIDVLDDSKKDEAALVKKFGAYFTNLSPSKPKPEPEPEPKAAPAKAEAPKPLTSTTGKS